MAVNYETLRERLREDIAKRALVTREQRPIFAEFDPPIRWLFDFKGMLLSENALSIVSELFWNHLKAFAPLQVGGLETTAIALTAGIVMKARQDGVALNGFYIRKSRKKDGMQRMLEGKLDDEKIILVDDSLNTGRSFMRQIKLLEAEGRKVEEVCVIIRFRDPAFYEYLNERGIRIWSLFTLDDFPKTGGLLKAAHHAPPAESFAINWKFESTAPNYGYRGPKSAPAIDGERVYFGADNGSMWALNQNDGSVAWNFKVAFLPKKNRVFSSPLLYQGVLYVGAFDGNFYALNAKSGAKKWTYWEADWITSSPCVAPDLGRLYVGLRYGLFRKRGGIVALDARTGEEIWLKKIESEIHSSPAYAAKMSMIIVGSEDGTVYGLDAKTGAQRWAYKTEGPVRASFAFDEKQDLVCFGSFDKYLYALNAKIGELMRKIETLEPICSTPIVENGRLYSGLLDKRVVCVDLESGEVIWKHWTHSRVFAEPVMIEGHLYIGSYDGRLYELDPKDGKEISYLQLTERIPDKIAYNPASKRFFIATYANELYCVTKKNADQLK